MRAAYTVTEFCEAFRISRTQLYKMWRQGTGPRRILIGSKILISIEAAADWRREREAAAPADERAPPHAEPEAACPKQRV